MNGGISDTTTTPATNDPAALLGTLMAPASPSGVSNSPQAGATVANAKTGGIRVGDTIYYADGSSEKVDSGGTGTVPGTLTPPGGIGGVEPTTTPPTDEAPPPDAASTVSPWIPAGEGSVNKDARLSGEMLSAFLAAFQAAYQRNNPNFNFTRNPRLATTNMPYKSTI